jgi:hypothetical protein
VGFDVIYPTSVERYLNIGSRRRFNDTVMGDAVNPCLGSGTGEQDLRHGYAGERHDNGGLRPDRVNFREIDLVRVVGRGALVRIFEPLGFDERRGADT